jgi:hypothetical protein
MQYHFASAHNSLDHESFNLVLQASDLVHEITGLVRSDRGSDDSATNSTGTPKGGLARDINIRDVLRAKISAGVKFHVTEYEPCPRTRGEDGGEWREGQYQLQG